MKFFFLGCYFVLKNQEKNQQCKKEKTIHKNVVDDELEYEDYSNVLFKISYARQEINRI